MKSKFLFFLIVTICIPKISFAQTFEITPDLKHVWGGETIEYTRSTSACTELTWFLTNGIFQGTPNYTILTTSSPKVKVVWNNISTPGGAINVQCSENYAIRSDINILSLKGLELAEPAGTSSVQFCHTSPITYSIPKVEIPLSGNNNGTAKYASGYEWTIPSGWTGPGGQTGTFKIDNANAYSIQLTPNSCGGGQVIVRAYTNTEGKGTPHYSEFSAPLILDREMPEITTSTSTYKCNVPFTASIPLLLCASTYSWNVPTGWQIQGSGNSVTIIPNSNDGAISVTANLSGQSCSPQASTKQIQLENPIQSINGLDNGACGTTFYVPALEPGFTLSWTHSSNLQRINPGSSSALQVVPTNPSSYAPGWVKATVTNPNGCTFEKIKNIWVGIPGLPSTSFQSFNVYGGGTFTAPSFAGISTGYTWTVSGSLTIVSGGGINDNTITVSINPNQTFGDIFVRARNSCGSSQQPSQIRVNRIQSFNYSAYPNPVINELTIEAEKIDTTSRELQPFEVKIYDESGNEIFNRKMKDAKNKISVNGFKGGFYYLHIISEDGIIRKKIKIEK